MPCANTRDTGVVSNFISKKATLLMIKFNSMPLGVTTLATLLTFLGSMILKEFPNLTWLRSQAERRFADGRSWTGAKLTTTGWPNVILNVSADNILRDNIRGPLSLFTNISGESTLEISRRRILIKEDFFFLSNYDQHYSLEIEKGKRTETFNIHFGDYFCDQVLSSLSQKPDQLLDGYFQQPSERMEFHNRIYHRDELTQMLIMEIRRGAHGSAWLEEKLYALLENLLKKEKDLIEIQSRFPALKSSTRQEILRRMLIVSDYIHTHLHEDLSLEQLANVGCFSKFHFLRLFKLAFNKTPYQFINEERVRLGRQMLERTMVSINEIAHSLGFTNPSSFSRMFFNHTGVYPTQLRPAYH
jgi:AraC family transcriptional regulator